MYKGIRLLSRKTLNVLPFTRPLTNETKNVHQQCEEVRIPVQWGHIAGKWWGPKNKRPILAIHGWQDNACTFDPLVPYLPANTPILAIDLPGHGLSSKLPRGVMYYSIDLVRWIHQIAEYFQWPKVSLLGHSMGAVGSALYSIYFSHMVDFLICIDNIKVVPLPDDQRGIGHTRRVIEMFLKYDELNDTKPRAYTWEECEKLLTEGSGGSVALESCKYLLKRSLTPSADDPNKFQFTRDFRVKAFYVIVSSQKETINLYKNITCPVLMMKADKSSYYEKKESFYELLEELKKSSKDCRYFYVSGTHHVHLNNPELLAGHINDFLKTHDVEDRTIEFSRKEVLL